MFSPRLVFGSVTLLFLVLLIVDWTSLDKESKLERSVSVQSAVVGDGWANINNDVLDIYVSLSDGSVREAFLFEKAERDGLYKTRLLSDDSLLRFFFKTNVDGFSNSSPYVIDESSSDYLKISSEDINGNVLTKIYYFDSPNTLYIEDRFDLAVPAFGNVLVFKTFWRDRNKSIDYGTTFSRDHLAYSTSEDVFNDEQLSSVDGREDYMGNWIGYSQKHFVVAVYDDAEQQKISLYPPDSSGLYKFGFSEDADFDGNAYSSKTRVFIGPKQKDILESVAPYFQYNLDLGFVYGIGEFFIVVLNFLYSLVGSWGMAIVLLTVLFKVVLSPLQIIQIRSMVKMRKLQPKIQDIQNRYKNDRNKLGMEMMQLYSKEKFNPFAGCFPLIPQIPIFLAMFWVTREAFEFRGESFLWIPDLAESDPYLITPVLMGLMMFLSQKIMPKPPQNQGMQAQIAQQMMLVFPPMLTLIFIFMPAGVVIYSVVNMVLSVVPQAIILSRAAASENE
tara:strand:- start:491 stop:1999 length:1509 start_codon:yes stop_codon:yes gene_type:complete